MGVRWKYDNDTLEARQQKLKRTEKKKKKRKEIKWLKSFYDSVCTHLMFSMVSSGIGATVCTAGRFLLVAPLTNDDEEEEDEEAESAPPGGGGIGRNTEKK